MNEIDIILEPGADVFLSDPQSVNPLFLDVSLCRLSWSSSDNLYETYGIPSAVEFQVLDHTV